MRTGAGALPFWGWLLVVLLMVAGAGGCQSVDGGGLTSVDRGTLDGAVADGRGDARDGGGGVVGDAAGAPLTADAKAGVGDALSPAGDAAFDAPALVADAGVPAADVASSSMDGAAIGDAPVQPLDTRPPTPGCKPAAEVCDLKDNDCDGEVDEGIGVEVINTTYTALSVFHGGCNALARFGPGCNAAANRFCAGKRCFASGFAPVENAGDVAVVGCVANATVRAIPLATLTGLHAGCVAESQHSPACNAAIQRYCGTQGFVAGFGPVEASADMSWVACLGADRATVIETTYTVLASHHPGCTAGGERFGPACNAAIGRFCAAQGHRTGFGPVENAGEVAVVTCVKS